MFINKERVKHRRSTAEFVQQKLHYDSRVGVDDNMKVLAIVAIFHPYNYIETFNFYNNTRNQDSFCISVLGM